MQGLGSIIFLPCTRRGVNKYSPTIMEVDNSFLNERNLILEIHTDIHTHFPQKKHDCGFGIRGIALQVLVTRLYLNKWLQSLVYETTWVDFRECNTGSAGTRGAWLWAPYRRDPEKKNEWNQSTIPQRLNRKVSGNFPGFSTTAVVKGDGWIFRTGKIWDAKGILVTSVAWTPGCPAIDILSLKLTSLRTWKMDGPGILSRFLLGFCPCSGAF